MKPKPGSILPCTMFQTRVRLQSITFANKIIVKPRTHLPWAEDLRLNPNGERASPHPLAANTQKSNQIRTLIHQTPNPNPSPLNKNPRNQYFFNNEVAKTKS